MDMEFANERERLKKEVGIFGSVEHFLLGVFFFVVEEKFTIKKHQQEGCFFFQVVFLRSCGLVVRISDGKIFFSLDQCKRTGI